jgi:fluoroquinolone transport system permease protein
VYILILLFYWFLLSIFDGEMLIILKRVLLFSEPIVLGFFFMGGIYLIEKQEGIIEEMLVTPRKIFHYFLAKHLAFLCVGIVLGTIISLIRTNEFSFGLLLTLFLSNVLFTSFGILVSLKAQNVNQYILISIGFSFLLMIPFGLMILLGNPFYLIYHPFGLIYLLAIHPFVIIPYAEGWLWLLLASQVVMMFLVIYRIFSRHVRFGR